MISVDDGHKAEVPAYQRAQLGCAADLDAFAAGASAPLTETELKLVHIWRRLLDRETIGVWDDFFGLGGDLLAALVLVEEIESIFGVRFQLHDVTNLPTVAEQAHAIVETRSPAEAQLPSHVVVGRATGAQSPLFLVHSAWGFSFLKRTFLEELGQDRPVFSFQAPGFDGQMRPLTSVKEMAKLYVRTMRDIQPHGPYNIVALCAGAFIALEMANLLKAGGLKVGRLIFLDPPANAPFFQEKFKRQERIREKMRAVYNWSASSKPKLAAVLKRFLRRAASGGRLPADAPSLDRLRSKIQHRALRSVDWIDETADLPETMVRTVKELKSAVRKHVPRSYAGTAVMLLTDRTALNEGSFWRRHLQGIDYQVRDWEHKDIFGVHLVETARFVKDALEVPWDSRLMPSTLAGSLLTKISLSEGAGLTLDWGLVFNIGNQVVRFLAH